MARNTPDEAMDTRLAHLGRDTGVALSVNPPVYHASTILFPSLEEYDRRASAPFRYGRGDTPTILALKEAVTALEGGAGAILAPSGVSAIAVTLMAFARPGAHFLVTDAVYGPVRKLCDGLLAEMGVTTTYVPPTIGAGIEALLRPETRLAWLETPASGTFEMQDLPAILGVLRGRGIVTAADNSWGAGYFLRPLALGVDISVQSATKYIGGHSDVMLGCAVANEATLPKLKATAAALGVTAGPDDVYLALRGLRTLGLRMRRHHESGLAVARFLQARPEVKRVMHPGLPEHPGHTLWRRDFTGASGLFGFSLRDKDRARLGRFLDGLRYFGMGASWGGYESLLIPTAPTRTCAADYPAEDEQAMRIHIGLEEPEDLIRDLAAGLDRWAAG